MDVNTIKEKKKLLQAEISKEVSILVEAFIAETGINPISISIDMLRCHKLGIGITCIVGETHIQLDI